ncbi:chromo domain-containing protein [Streptomyces sundarbansensis]
MNDFEDYSQEKDEANKEKINRELLANIKRLTEIVFPAIHERTQVITNKQKERFDASHKLITIPENSYVMVKVNLKTNKLDPDYQGPYKVKRITQGGSYVLEDEMGELLPKNYPPSALKLISQDEVISTDKFYQVEAILTHKKEKGKYLYKCRWKGYNKSDDTWEPATNFADPKFITEYWQRIGIIPEDIKKKYSMKFNKGKTIDNESAVNSKSGKRKMSLDLKGNSHSSTTYKGVNNGDNSNKRSKRH